MNVSNGPSGSSQKEDVEPKHLPGGCAKVPLKLTHLHSLISFDFNTMTSPLASFIPRELKTWE